MTRRPRLSAWLLARWLPREDRDEILGDLDEQFGTRARLSARDARRWYRTQAFDLMWRYRARPHVPYGAPGGRRSMLFDDVRQVLRRFRSQPGPAVLIAVILSTAIGLSTGTFAVVDSLMLERAPFRDPDRLRTVVIQRLFGKDNPELVKLMKAWREAGIFDAVEAAGVVPLDGAPPDTGGSAAVVSPGLFDMLGVRPVRGRGFTEDDARAGSVQPVMISERLWRDAFGADDARLGGLVSLGNREYRLVGVMPADFRFPDWNTQVWRPLSLDAVPFPNAAGRYAYVRLLPGVPDADVLARATEIARQADPRFAARPNELGAWPIGGTLDEHAARALPLFGSAVALIFLALCANASGLLLARMTARRRELGVRLSLGASRWRLLREAVLEHAWIAAAGVLGGIGLAHAVTTIAPRLMSEGFALTQSLNPINVDGRALATAALLGVAAVLMAGLLPAWVGTRVDAADAVKPSERTHTDSRRGRALTRTLLVAQVAFASMLVLGAALLVRSFVRMATADRGMNPRGVHTLTSFMSSVAPAVLDDVEARVAAIPGVEDVTVAGAAPPLASFTFTGRWRTDLVAGLELQSNLYEIRPDFFDFFGVTLVSGRPFEPGDANVAIVGERTAAILWPGGDALGKTMTMEDGPLRLEVIGLARDIVLPSLIEGADVPELYLPYSGRRKVLTVAWKCAARCPDRPQVVAAIRDADPKAEPVDRIASAEESYARHLVRPRVAAQLGATFASVGFLTSGAGLFAVLSYAVGRRRREFGIRTALAPRRAPCAGASRARRCVWPRSGWRSAAAAPGCCSEGSRR